MSASLQRALGSVCRTFIAATVVGSFSTLAIISLGGFILPLCKVQFMTSMQMVANIISIALIPFFYLCSFFSSLDDLGILDLPIVLR